ncbi:MAG: serine--tRNA ligase [Patescibacteria group bacterium]|nr:serine--tRNA ligase [Patescibacteria group bacterium]
MLDISYIREHIDEIKANSKNRGSKVDIDKFLGLDKKRVKLIQEVDELRNKKNSFKGKPTANELKLLSKNKEKEETLSKTLSEIENQYFDLLMQIPNLTHPKVKISDNEDDNPVIENKFKPTKFTFTPKDHVSLAEKLDLIDFERASKITGAKFFFLKNEAALLELALTQYAFQIAIKHGFIPFVTPDLAKKEVLNAMGYNPRGESTQIYNIEDSDLSLIGTAEVTMGGYHKDEILKELELPKKYVALSHCFRTEAGSYSKFSKGIFRVHQFTKVEMFIYTTPGESEKAHQEILEIEKEIFDSLKIPYRVIDHCTADLGSPAYRTFDLEAWMPGKPNKNGSMGDWAEITSTSNCTDYQSRALNIKYLSKNGTKNFVHTLNGTAIAMTRPIIAILENNQQKDGSVLIPEVLQKVVGRAKIERKDK